MNWDGTGTAHLADDLDLHSVLLAEFLADADGFAHGSSQQEVDRAALADAAGDGAQEHGDDEEAEHGHGDWTGRGARGIAGSNGKEA